MLKLGDAEPICPCLGSPIAGCRYQSEDGRWRRRGKWGEMEEDSKDVSWLRRYFCWISEAVLDMSGVLVL